MRKVQFCTAALLLVSAAASAATIYAPNGLPRPYPFTGPDQLIRFDSANPAGFTIIGSMNIPDIGFGGMDFDRNGNLWAYASFYKSTGGAAAGLYRVDMNTGAATLQGTASLQSLQDMAFNPVDNKMYGINTQGVVTKLYTINLTSGAVTTFGTVTGLPANQHSMGLAIDSSGNFYIHDINVDAIYKAGADLAASFLYQIPQDTNYSQGMTIDWSRDNMGYHNAVGQGVYPDYFSTLNTFAIDGSGYHVGPDFGPNEYYNGIGYPLVECGDLAIMPVPEPASFLLLALAAFLRRR